MKAVNMRAAIARRRNMDDGRGGVTVLFLDVANQLTHVLAEGFRQARRGRADELRLILARNVQRTLREILAAAEDRALLVEIRRRDVNRFAEMADEIAANVSRAALPAVQKWDAALDAAKRQACAERRVELAGIARGGEILRLRFVIQFLVGRVDDGGGRTGKIDGAKRRALTVSRAVASSGATQIVHLHFLDVGF